MWPDSLRTHREAEWAHWWQQTSCPSPETSPALKWPAPALGPEECDTSRCTDAPETWSLRGDHSTVHCSWTCDPAGERTDYQTRETAGIRLVETKHYMHASMSTHTCILRMWSLSRLWTIDSTSFCMRAWWASAISVRPVKFSPMFETSL